MFICIIPLMALFMTFFAVAFARESLGLIILSIMFMLNPIVAIPLNLVMTSILEGIQQLSKRICNAPGGGVHIVLESLTVPHPD